MTERTSTTEPVRRRIGDRDSRGFRPPTSQTGSEEGTTVAEQHTELVDSDAEAAPAPSRRQSISAPDLSRNPGQIRTQNASAPEGTGPGDEGPGRRSIGDRPTPRPASAGSTSSTAVAEAAVHQAGLEEPVGDTRPAVDDSRPADVPKGTRTEGPTRRSFVRPARRTVLVGALIVVLLAATIFFGLKWRSQDNLNGLRSSALSSAKTDGALLSSYDYRNLTGPGSSFAKVLKNATPTFRKNFQSTSGTLDKLLTQYNATATGTVISAGVASFSSSRAVVLLFIDQTVNNTVQKSASATQPLRTQVTLLHQNGRWLIDDLQVPK